MAWVAACDWIRSRMSPAAVEHARARRVARQDTCDSALAIVSAVCCGASSGRRNTAPGMVTRVTWGADSERGALGVGEAAVALLGVDEPDRGGRDAAQLGGEVPQVPRAM